MPRAWAFVLLLVPWGAAHAAEYALLVGVNDCPDFRTQDGTRPRPLHGAERDAEQMADLLRNQFGFAPRRVRLMQGAKANSAAVLSAFRELHDLLTADDVLVFYFAGHGTQFEDQRPFDEEDRLDEALCLADATADGAGLLLDDELGRWLDELPVREVVVVLDCCHAGTGIKTADDEFIPRYLPMPRVKRAAGAVDAPWSDLRSSSKQFGRRTTAFYACQPEQQAYERRLPGLKAPLRAGQFTNFLVTALKDCRADADGDRTVSNREALLFVRERLDSTFNSTRRNVADRQEPTFDSDFEEGPAFGKPAVCAGSPDSRSRPE